MKKLILRCSGANFQTLMRSEVAADRERYIGYGLLVILSAVFCFICTFYLIFCFEKSIIIALLMSCVITGIKFTLDFLIVPTMPLLESSWTLVLILKTLFRLSMALILSIFLSFVPKIVFFKADILNYRLEKAVEPIVQRLEKEKTAIEETLRKDGELYGELKIDAKEIEKTKFKTTLRKSATTAYNAWRDSEKRNEQRLDSLQRLIIEYNNPNDRKRLSLKRQMSLENDFTPLDDYKVLGEINRLDSDKNFISWVMTLLFLILEMAPFMYKSLDLDGEFVWISQNIAQKVHLNLVNPKQQVTYNEEKNETKPISVTEPKREQATYFTFSKNGIGS